MRAPALVLLLALAVVPAGARAAALPATFGERVDALVRAELERQHVPGVEVGVALDGAVVIDRGYGSRDLASGSAVDGRTRFALGSITKSFTALLVMQLAAQHRLALDDRLNRYVPEAPHAREVTIRQLLTQTTGLADYLGGDLRAIATRSDVTPAELLARIATEPLGFDPGSHYAYSNTNYLLLGMIVEHITRSPYESGLRHAVLDPVHLDGISYGRPAAPDVATGYDANAPVQLWTPAVLRAAGALWGDVTDLLQFDQAFFAGRIVAPPLVATMTAAGAPLRAFDYAYGWVVSDLGGHREVWHNGGVPGFTARNSVFPADRLAIAVLGNSTTFDEAPIVRGILALIDPGVLTHPQSQIGTATDDPTVAALAGAVFRETQRGTIDRTRYTAAASREFTDVLIAAVGAQLAPLGSPSEVTLQSRAFRGNQQIFVYRLQFAAFAVDETLVLDGNHKIAGLLFRPANLAPVP